MLTWNNQIQDIGDTTATVMQGVCLSTDSKPLNVGNGSVLIEMDTKKVYFFDLKNKTWREYE